MNTKHTPGPWTVTVNGINSPDGHIVFFDVSGGPHEADARLIAAAPALLEALKMAYADLVKVANERGETNEFTSGAEAKVIRA